MSPARPNGPTNASRRRLAAQAAAAEAPGASGRCLREGKGAAGQRRRSALREWLGCRTASRPTRRTAIEPEGAGAGGPGVADDAPLWSFNVRGTAFLWHQARRALPLPHGTEGEGCSCLMTDPPARPRQVRCMMAVLFLVGKGMEPPEVVARLLDLDATPRKPVYPMAPDEPLILFACGCAPHAHPRTRAAAPHPGAPGRGVALCYGAVCSEARGMGRGGGFVRVLQVPGIGSGGLGGGAQGDGGGAAGAGAAPRDAREDAVPRAEAPRRRSEVRARGGSICACAARPRRALAACSE